MVEGVGDLLAFLGRVFEAEEISRVHRPDGSIMHAEVRMGDSRVMMGEPVPGLGLAPGSIYLYVTDCDAVYQRAVDDGAESVMEPTTMAHAGERYGGVKDPAGNVWWIATHVEDVTPEEEARRISENPDRWTP
jgi:uncharacterized glyoxalase superfamily protein PhnB